MVVVDPKALASAHQFTVVIDGVETAVHEGVLRRNGGTVAVVGPGVLEVSRLQHVVVRGGGGGDVRFSRCGYAAAEDCGAASFHRCDAVRVGGAARDVAVRRCRSADVERVEGAVAIHRCKGAARVRGAGELRVGRCREADVGGCADVAVARCRAATVAGCGTVAVRRGKVNVVEMGQQVPLDYHQQEKTTMMYQQGEPVLATPVAIVAK